MRTNVRIRAGAIATLFAAIFMLSACDQASDVSEDEFIERAQQYRQAGDLRSSSIELKNALQKNPNSARARLLLGQIYLDIGDGASAEKELMRAINLGMDRQSVQRALGQAWLLQQKFQKILDNIKISDTSTAIGQAAILTLYGQAYTGLNQLDQAIAKFKTAVEKDPKSVGAYVGLSRIALRKKDAAGAKSYLKAAQEQAPNNSLVVALGGDIAFFEGAYADSETAYQKLINVQPNNIVYLIGLSRAQIGAGKYGPAGANLDKALKSSPRNPVANYLRAIVAYQQHDYESAKNYVEQVLNVATGDLRSLLLSGASSYAVGELEQARKRLTQYLSEVPKDEHARRLLGATLLRLSQSQNALHQLQPLVHSSSKDAELLMMVGTAAVESGNLEAGRDYFSRAVKLNPNDPVARSSLGAANIRMGKTEEGIEDLEKALQSDKAVPGIDAALILNQYKAGKFEDALKSAVRLQEKVPDHPAGFIMAGMALIKLGRTDEAKAMFKKALEVRPGDVTASNHLASLARIAGDNEEAKRLLTEALKANPDNEVIQIRLGLIEFELKNLEKSIEYLSAAVNSHPEDLIPRLYLGRVYRAARRPSKALEVTSFIANKYPTDPGLLEVIGDAQLDLDQADNALSTFRRLAGIKPNVASAHYLVGLAAEKARQWDEAEKAAEKALAIQPKLYSAKALQVRLHIHKGEIDQARTLLDELKKARPDDPYVWELEGVVHMALNQFDEAIKVLRRAWEKSANTERTLKLAVAYFRNSQKDEGLDILEKWVAKYPQDVRASLMLATTYLQLGEFDKSANQYQALLDEGVNTAAIQNQLAWARMQLGDLASAEEHANESLDQEPNNPLALDTLGVIAIKKNDTELAVKTLSKAKAGAPDNRQISFHLADALARAGDKDKARKILNTILSKAGTFPERKQAEQLAEKLEK